MTENQNNMNKRRRLTKDGPLPIGIVAHAKPDPLLEMFRHNEFMTPFDPNYGVPAGRRKRRVGSGWHY